MFAVRSGSDDDGRRRVASSDGIGTRSGPVSLSDRMMILKPSCTAFSARSQRRKSAPSSPAAPFSAEKVMSRVTVWNWLSAMSPIMRIFSSPLLAKIGCGATIRFFSDVPSRSRMFGRGPMKVTSDITSSSRIGSMGGFVTWAKFCLK